MGEPENRIKSWFYHLAPVYLSLSFTICKIENLTHPSKFYHKFKRNNVHYDIANMSGMIKVLNNIVIPIHWRFNHSSTQWESLSTYYQNVPGSDSYLGWGGSLQLKASPGGSSTMRPRQLMASIVENIIIDMRNWNWRTKVLRLANRKPKEKRLLQLTWKAIYWLSSYEQANMSFRYKVIIIWGGENE